MKEKVVITTDQNQNIKQLRALQKRKTRDEEGKFMVEGIRFLEEALQNDCLEKVLSTLEASHHPRVEAFLINCREKNIPVFEVEEKVFAKVSETVNSQGIIGVGHQPNWLAEDLEKGSLILLIDGIQDPGNLGTILRTCQAAGVSGVILSKGTVDVYNPKVLRATMGAIFNLPIVKWDENQDILQQFKAKGFQVIAADIDTQTSIYEVDLREPSIIIVGNEANGPQSMILEEADIRAKLPMPGQMESLNVAVATGILIFEALRQRQLTP